MQFQRVTENNTNIESGHDADRIHRFYSNCVDTGYRKFKDIVTKDLNFYLKKLKIKKKNYGIIY